MQQKDLEMPMPRARVLTDEELRQALGGSVFSDLSRWLRSFVDPLPVRRPLADAIHRAWEAVKQAT